MGFCLYNSIAVGAAYARARGLSRVAVVDYDVHHGNGTQWMFYDDPSVLFVSSHQFPFYPGTGAATETGRGEGLGTTVNLPLEAGAGDADYDLVYREVCGLIEEHRPQLVLVSAGFDAHERDPLAGMRMTTEGFARVTARLLLDRRCRVRRSSGVRHRGRLRHACARRVLPARHRSGVDGSRHLADAADRRHQARRRRAESGARRACWTLEVAEVDRQDPMRVACDAKTSHRPERRAKTSVNRSATVTGLAPPVVTDVRPVTTAVSPSCRTVSSSTRISSMGGRVSLHMRERFGLGDDRGGDVDHRPFGREKCAPAVAVTGFPCRCQLLLDRFELADGRRVRLLQKEHERKQGNHPSSLT